MRKRLCFSKRFFDFFSAFVLVVHAALPLVDLGERIPVRFVALNAVRLHEGKDSIILAREGILKGVQLLPQLHLKTVADSVRQLLPTILTKVWHHRIFYEYKGRRFGDTTKFFAILFS